MITACPGCRKLYEERSREDADDPGRRCPSCFVRLCRELDHGDGGEIEPYQYASMKAPPPPGF